MRQSGGFHSDPALPPHLGHLQTAGATGRVLSGRQSGLTTKNRNPASLSREDAGDGTFPLEPSRPWSLKMCPAQHALADARPTRPRAAGDPTLQHLVLAPGSSSSDYSRNQEGRSTTVPQLSACYTQLSSGRRLPSSHLSPRSLGSFTSPAPPHTPCSYATEPFRLVRTHRE